MMKMCYRVSAAAIVAAAGWAHAADRATNQTPPADAASVRATFLQQPDGATGKFEPATPDKPRRLAPWDRPARDVPADLRAAELPTYYVCAGRAVPMRIDGRLILAAFTEAEKPGGPQAVELAARVIGVPVAAVRECSVSGYVMIEPAAPLADAAAVDAVINLLLTDARFTFAGPVFHHPEIEGGFVAFMPEINLRVSQANVLAAAETIRQTTKNARIVENEPAGLSGAARISTGERNGFVVLRTANELALDPNLAWACPTQLSTMDMHVYAPNDQYYGAGSMWGWRNPGGTGFVLGFDCDADDAWELTRGNPAVVVLCLDLGSDQFHPDLNQLTGKDFSNGSVGGFGIGQPVTSCDNHGTPVAGIIAGRINNSIGGAGVCPNCRVLSAKVGTTPEPAPGDPCGGAWGSVGGTPTTLDVRLANALLWGESQGARISNGSYGTGETDLLTDTYNSTAANGMLHFASAGNGGADNIGDAALGYPARLSTVQSVAAIDSDATRSSFSNYGTGLDFSAPGTNVRSTDRSGSVGYSGTDYTTFSGTSAASPFAAGCAALIWSAYPQGDDNFIRLLMDFYCTDMGTAGYDTGFGWGFPNVNDSIRSVFPQNNWCLLATPIVTNAYAPADFSVANASEVPEELDESCEGGGVGVSHSVWYRYEPACSGDLSVNTNGSDYDTVLSVWRGDCDSAVQVSCDDDSGTGTQSQITDLHLNAGQTYYIKVSAYGVNNAGGSLDFNFLFDPPSASNDLCSDAFDIPFNHLVLNTCTGAATTTPCEGNEPCEVGNVGTSRSVWYEFTTPTIGRFDLSTAGSSYDTVLSVWRGPCGTFADFGNGQILCLTPPIYVACDDDAPPSLTSEINDLVVDAGITYRFKAAAYGANAAGGDLTFDFTFTPCPADFNLSGAVSVQDIFDFLAAYFANDPRANFNFFGGITVQDIFDFLAAYFGGGC